MPVYLVVPGQPLPMSKRTRKTQTGSDQGRDDYHDPTAGIGGAPPAAAR
jgi:hypothetical protein